MTRLLTVIRVVKCKQTTGTVWVFLFFNTRCLLEQKLLAEQTRNFTFNDYFVLINHNLRCEQFSDRTPCLKSKKFTQHPRLWLQTHVVRAPIAERGVEEHTHIYTVAENYKCTTHFKGCRLINKKRLLQMLQSSSKSPGRDE